VTTFRGPAPESEEGIGALTIGGLLDDAAERFGPREALCFHPEGQPVVRWTYDELRSESTRLANGLIAAGLGKGGRVGLLMGSRPEWVAAAFAVAQAGGVLVPINTFLAPRELGDVLAQTAVSLILHQDRLASHDFSAQLAAIEPSLPFPARLVCLGTDGWDDLLRAGETIVDGALRRRSDAVSPYDDGIVVTTSGTTERPKSVLHAHRAAAIQSYRFVSQLGLDETSRVWSAYPFFWSAGFCMVMGASLASGGCLVLQEVFEPGEALRLLESERVTSPHAWAHQLAALEDHEAWARTDLSSLVHVDASMSFARHPTVRCDGSWSTRAAYGLTETFTIVTAVAATAPPAARVGGHHGPLLPGVVIRIVDPETGDPSPEGTSGEIRVKGPTLMKGYLGIAPEDTFDEDAFFPTGDAGFVDDAGCLHWTGRSSGLIKTGGANVSPVEVEMALLSNPDLKAAVAVGVPHATLGEMLVVCAVAHHNAEVDEESVRAWMKGRVASYKIPRRIVFVDESDLEVTGNSKLRIDVLRDLAIKRLA
jgi:fatty-acyl-CoA synthase